MAGDQQSAHPARSSDSPSVHVGVETATDGETPPQHHTPASGIPLPPAWPIAENGAASPSSAAHPAETLRDPDASGVQPRVEPGRWVHEPDFWEKETMIAMTGRYPVPRPKTRSLPPPQRFRPMARWKSMLVLGVLVVVTALACVGSIELGKLSIDAFGPTTTPTVTQTAQPTVSPTRPPHK